MEGPAGGGQARVAAWSVLVYALLTLVVWLSAPWAFPAMLLPLTRPLSAVMLAALAAITLASRGPLERRDLRAVAALVAAVAAWSLAVDLLSAGAGTGGAVPASAAWGGPWAPYLGDTSPWVSGWTAAPLALTALAMLVSPRGTKASGRLLLVSAVLSYVVVLAWVAGADAAATLELGTRTFPLTQLAIIVLTVSIGRSAMVPRLLTHDMPDSRSSRRWDILILGSALVPVFVVALLNLALQLPFVNAALGNAIVGITLGAVLLSATWRYIEQDRALRRQEQQVLEEAEHLALHDPLTGLATRTLALEALARAIARSRRSTHLVTVLFCDLDGLKRVNDVFGHAAGDILITAVAERLAHAVRDEDVVARLGGDEFLVITERLATGEERMAFADRVLASVAVPIELDGTQLHPAISDGVAVAGHDEHPIEVIRNADAAMYKAKANGRGRWEIYDPTMRREIEQRRRLESEMRIALMGREIEVHLQPIVRLHDGAPVAAEAFARWRHPEHGLMDARAWLSVAEESAHLVAIGRFVIVSACRWMTGDGAALDYVSINLSPRELGQEDMASFCRTQSQRFAIPPSRLAFEVSDETLTAGGSVARAQVRALADMGFRILVDCFGTGRDALSTWRDLPVAGLKLDREVAALLHTDQGVRAAAAGAGLAAGLRIVGIACGIETAEQEQEFRRLGWEFGQGYRFARPALLGEPGRARDAG